VSEHRAEALGTVIVYDFQRSRCAEAEIVRVRTFNARRACMLRYPLPSGKTALKFLEDEEADLALKAGEYVLSETDTKAWGEPPAEQTTGAHGRSKEEETPDGRYNPGRQNGNAREQGGNEGDTAAETDTEAGQESEMLGSNEDLRNVLAEFVRATR